MAPKRGATGPQSSLLDRMQQHQQPANWAAGDAHDGAHDDSIEEGEAGAAWAYDPEPARVEHTGSRSRSRSRTGASDKSSGKAQATARAPANKDRTKHPRQSRSPSLPHTLPFTIDLTGERSGSPSIRGHSEAGADDQQPPFEPLQQRADDASMQWAPPEWAPVGTRTPSLVHQVQARQFQPRDARGDVVRPTPPSKRFWRRAEWSPEGTHLLAQSENHHLDLFTLSPSPSPPRLVHTLRIPTPSTLLSFAWYPFARASTPATFVFALSSPSVPIRLVDAHTGATRATYGIEDHVERFVAPHALAFSTDGRSLYAGHRTSLTVIDLAKPGTNTGTTVQLAPPGIAAEEGAQAGIVSAMAVGPVAGTPPGDADADAPPAPASTGDYLAVGTFSGTVGIYQRTSHPALSPALWIDAVQHKQPSAARALCIAGWNEQRGTGISQLRFHPHASYILFVSTRNDAVVRCYDLRYLSAGGAAGPRFHEPPGDGAVIARFDRGDDNSGDKGAPAGAHADTPPRKGKLGTQQRLFFDVDWAGRCFVAGTPGGKVKVWSLVEAEGAGQEDERGESATRDRTPAAQWTLAADRISSVALHPTRALLLTTCGSRRWDRGEGGTATAHQPARKRMRLGAAAGGTSDEPIALGDSSSASGSESSGSEPASDSDDSTSPTAAAGDWATRDARIALWDLAPRDATQGAAEVTRGNGDQGRKETPDEDADSAKSKPALLLPEHVTQVESTQGPSVGDAADADLGDFTQLDADSGGASRYFEAAKAEEAKQFKECEICHEKGHTRKECKHMLCAACGAMDEHPTRGCPVGISCFRCGKRGHRVADCPMSYRDAARSNAHHCARCGSTNHIDVSCPTYWRIYAYVDEDEWEDFREDKARELGVRKGGGGGGGGGDDARRKKQKRRRRGADSSDMDTDSQEEEGESRVPPNWDPAERWCYNCASHSTHWGDDCPHPRRAMGRNGEPSIFSEFISSSGPFAPRLALPPPRGPAAGDMSMGGRGDLYDVPVGPTASMHFAPPRANGPAGGETLEEYIDGVFARAPRSRLGRVDRDRRGRERERDRTLPPRPATGTSTSASATTGSGKDKGKSKTKGKGRDTTGGTATAMAAGTEGKSKKRKRNKLPLEPEFDSGSDSGGGRSAHPPKESNKSKKSRAKKKAKLQGQGGEQAQGEAPRTRTRNLAIETDASVGRVPSYTEKQRMKEMDKAAERAARAKDKARKARAKANAKPKDKGGDRGKAQAGAGAGAAGTAKGKASAKASAKAKAKEAAYAKSRGDTQRRGEPTFGRFAGGGGGEGAEGEGQGQGQPAPKKVKVKKEKKEAKVKKEKKVKAEGERGMGMEIKGKAGAVKKERDGQNQPLYRGGYD